MNAFFTLGCLASDEALTRDERKDKRMRNNRERLGKKKIEQEAEIKQRTNKSEAEIKIEWSTNEQSSKEFKWHERMKK